VSAAAPTPGLRERKNRRTQEAIVRATAELTLQDGFAAATIPRIAERADVAPRTVSGWFPVKEDILFGGLEGTVTRAVQRLRDGDGDMVDRLLAWLLDEERHLHADDELHELGDLRFRAILSDPQLRAREVQLLEPIRTAIAEVAGEQTGWPAASMGPQVLATAAMGYLATLRARQLAGGADPGEREVGLALLRAGLAALQRR
jgi:AcrR family transcriptional regulator